MTTTRQRVKREFLAGEIDSGSAINTLVAQTQLNEEQARGIVEGWAKEKRELHREENVGKPGRYELQIFDTNGRRMSSHHCDGSFDFVEDALSAQLTAFQDINPPLVGSTLMRDRERFNGV